jgi:hypothetical protein
MCTQAGNLSDASACLLQQRGARPDLQHHPVHAIQRGVVVQTASPTGWKWTVYVPGRPPKSGTAVNRLFAIRHAEVAIEKAIKVKPAKTPTKQ